jgi:hypothetical protein
MPEARISPVAKFIWHRPRAEFASMLTTERQASTFPGCKGFDEKEQVLGSLSMARPTEEAQTLFNSAEHSFGQASMHIMNLTSLNADQMVFRLTQALDDHSVGCATMCRGLKKLAVAIHQVYQK